jgi:heme A synthase
MNCHGHPIVGITQAILGAIFVLYGVKVMIVNSFFYGTLDIGIGIVLLSFAQSEYNQTKIIERIEKIKNN